GSIVGRQTLLGAVGSVEARADHQLGGPDDSRAAAVVAARDVEDGGRDGGDGRGERLIERLECRKCHEELAWWKGLFRSTLPSAGTDVYRLFGEDLDGKCGGCLIGQGLTRPSFVHKYNSNVRVSFKQRRRT